MVFWLSMLAYPAFLMQKNLAFIAVLTVAAFLAQAFVYGKLKIWFSLQVIVSVVLLHLLFPSGRVFFEAGPLIISEEALKLGLRRALSIVGLTAFSRLAMSQGLKLPTLLGALIGRQLEYFNAFTASKRYPVSFKGLLFSLDAFLLEGRQSAQKPYTIQRRKNLAFALACLLAVLAWSLQCYSWLS